MQRAPLYQNELDAPNSLNIGGNPSTWPATESKLPGPAHAESTDAAWNRHQPTDMLQHYDALPVPVSWSDIESSNAFFHEKIKGGDDGTAASDPLEEEEDEVCSIGIQEFPITISKDLTLQLIQAPTAFRGVEHDETGGVVWGASICLARFLAPELVMGQTVLELGCGMGVPSLVSVKYGASRVIATDMEDKTLQQLDEVAKRNSCQDQLELCKLNWNDSNGKHKNSDNRHHPLHDGAADVILASDVIYHDQMVDSLVQTIDRYLSSDGTAYIALRNTRQGVRRFWREAMPEAGFVLMQSISCEEYQGGEDNDTSKLPPGFQNEAHSHRWRGDHTIYVFQRAHRQAKGQ